MFCCFYCSTNISYLHSLFSSSLQTLTLLFLIVSFFMFFLFPFSILFLFLPPPLLFLSICLCLFLSLSLSLSLSLYLSLFLPHVPTEEEPVVVGAIPPLPPWLPSPPSGILISLICQQRAAFSLRRTQSYTCWLHCFFNTLTSTRLFGGCLLPPLIQPW